MIKFYHFFVNKLTTNIKKFRDGVNVLTKLPIINDTEIEVTF